MKTFGSRLHALRKSRYWSQEKLGFELGVTKRQVGEQTRASGARYLLNIKHLFSEEALTLDFLAGERDSRREGTQHGGHRVAELSAAYDSDLRVARARRPSFSCCWIFAICQASVKRRCSSC